MAFLIFGVVISLWQTLKSETFNQPFLISFNSISGWEIATDGKNNRAIEISPETVVFPYLIILHLKGAEKYKSTALIIKDALTDDEYRYLKVLLKVSGTS